MAQPPPPVEPGSPPLLPLVGDPTSLLVGQFWFYVADDTWKWSAETAQIHGYPAVEMLPSTELVMSHEHPDDQAAITAAWDDGRRTRVSFNTRHRIVDVKGETREVVVVGQELRDEAGSVVGTHGFYVDVTPTSQWLEGLQRGRNREITEAVADIAKRRSVIEQVKGMLMLIYGIDADRAFDILRWRSQLTNTKLMPFAQQLVTDFRELDRPESLPSRTAFDDLLLTAHTRTTHPLAS